MDYRCPLCGNNLESRKLSKTVVARMEISCTQCENTLRHNYHKVEITIVLLGFGAFTALAAFAYPFQSQDFTLLAFGVAAVGVLASSLIEHTYLRA